MNSELDAGFKDKRAQPVVTQFALLIFSDFAAVSASSGLKLFFFFFSRALK